MATWHGKVLATQNSKLVDLCMSDDDDTEIVSPEIIELDDDSQSSVQGVARAPVRLDEDDDDDDDDIKIVGRPNSTIGRNRKGKIRAIDIEGAVVQLIDVDDDDDRKPAAINTNTEPAMRQRKRNLERCNAPPAKKPSPTKKVPPKQRDILDNILEVFPDVDRTHAMHLLVKYINDTNKVVSHLAEGSYPKEKNAANTANFSHTSSSVVVRRPLALPKYDYHSKSSFEPSPEYRAEATKQLLYEFPFLRCDGLKSMMNKFDFHYTLVRELIHNAIMGKEENDSTKITEEEEEAHYRALKDVRTFKRPSQKQIKRLGARNVKQSKRTSHEKPHITDPILQDELLHANQKLQTWMGGIEARISRLEARKRSQMMGNTVECACCFDQVAIEETISCREQGHLFCVDCIKGYAENQIFSAGNLGIDKRTKKPALELLCCHGDGCQSGFFDNHLQKALPPKTLEKYTQMQFQAAVERAGLGETMCSCPKCGFKADVPSTQMIFRCPMEDCRFESCRKCGKKPHIPLKCDEVEKVNRQDEGRLKVEEAISAAKIRTCPKCKTSFVKSEGCNKMVCPCGVRMCYICRKQLDKRDPYKHFCQVPHCEHKNCGNCVLHTNDEQDDARAMREAGVSAAEAYKHELKKKEGAPEVQIDVDKILR